MIVKQDLVNKIKDYFNLNVYETKVWLALLGKGVASAGEIAEISRVPRSRTYDVLETLERKGFAIVKIGKPVKYMGVKPEIMLERLKSNIVSDAKERMNFLLKIKTTEEFTKLEDLYKGGASPIKRNNLSAAMKGRANISGFLREIIRNAEKEIIICTNAKEIKSKMKLFQKTFETLKKANIKIKIALSGEEELIEQISKSLKIAVEKISIDTKFFIIDQKEILFYLSMESNKDEDSAIWVNSEFFAQALAFLFDKAVKNKG